MNSNRRKLEAWRVKPIIYREDDATICLLIDSGNNLVSRGVALLSRRDNPEKRLGNNIAIGRAIKAYENRNNSEEVRRRNISSLVYVYLMLENPSFKYKSSYRPKPTDREMDILNRLTCKEAKNVR